MALPFIVGAMMIAAGMTSYMKGTKAEDTNQEAKEMVTEARHDYCVARNRLQKAKVRACHSLEELGKAKVCVLAKDMISFVHLAKWLKAGGRASDLLADEPLEEVYKEVRYLNGLSVDWRKREKEETTAKEKMVLGACSVISTGEHAKPFSGVAALMARERDVMAGEDLRQVDGIVDFDEDVSSLSFLLDGFELAKKADENLEKAKDYYVEVKEADQKMNLVSDAFQAASGRANLLIDLIGKVHEKFHEAMSQLPNVMEDKADMDIYDQMNILALAKACQLVIMMQKILYTPLLDENGSVTQVSYLTYHEIKDVVEKNVHILT